MPGSMPSCGVSSPSTLVPQLLTSVGRVIIHDSIISSSRRLVRGIKPFRCSDDDLSVSAADGYRRLVTRL